MDKSRKQYLKAKGWPEPALEETANVPEKAQELLKTYLDSRVQVVLVTGQNGFYKDAVVGEILCGVPNVQYVHTPTCDSVPEGSIYYFSRFDAQMEFKQAYFVRNQIFRIVSRGGVVFLGVNSLESLNNAHGENFHREYNSVSRVLQLTSPQRPLTGDKL